MTVGSDLFCYLYLFYCLPSASTWVHPQYLVGSVLLIFLIFLCCPTMCFYILSFVLWCLLRYPHKNDVPFIFTYSCL